MKNILVNFLILLVVLYAFVCIALYFVQEKLLFHPSKLPENYTFNFNQKFEEVNLKTSDGVNLHCLHFRVKDSKGVVLFLHGNGGDLSDWGHGAALYTENGYDVFYLDYRGYGKSSGNISSEQQLVEDTQLAYDHLKSQYSESAIVLSGTSIGTGIASKVAAENDPKKLILVSPYFSLTSLVKEKVRLIPSVVLRYKLATNKNLMTVKCPIYILHGSEDQLIPLSHAKKLKEKFPQIDLTVLEGRGHNDVGISKDYLNKLSAILDF